MQRIGDTFIYSASDLNDFLECRRLSEYEELVAKGLVASPEVDRDSAELMQRKGHSHERAYLAVLAQQYPGEVTDLGRAESGIASYQAAAERTLDEMRKGTRIIYQATFFDGEFLGHADFLQRVETPSAHWAWSYEVVDTKLALSTKPYFIIQLCNYSEHLRRLQGTLPKFGSVVHGDSSVASYEIGEYAAYYRRLKSRFLEFANDGARAAAPTPVTYPIKREHCTFCDWNATCAQKRKNDDHLSLVARIRRDQIKKFEDSGIVTLEQLARTSTNEKPASLALPTFERLHDQAHLQSRGRASGKPLYELLDHDPRTGFGLLPEPNVGDVYFDMEGDPLYEPGTKLEYLFGAWLPNETEPFKEFWAYSPEQEKKAFEDFVDFVVARRAVYPQLHVYHYAPYERAALSRLAQQYQTREDIVDDLFREEVLVDLFAVARQTVLISEDSYSIKRFEKFYDFKRETDVKKGDDSITMFEKWRMNADPAIIRDIGLYNRDDCRSTYLLHRWLLERRLEAEATFHTAFPFREQKEAKAPCHDPLFEGCSNCRDRAAAQREDAKRSELERQLVAQARVVSGTKEYLRLPEYERAHYQMAHQLAYHRREDKPAYWVYFRRCENIDELVDFDGDAIGGLELCDDIPAEPIARSFIYTYRFPDQRHKMRPGKPHDPTTRKAVEVLEIDDEQNLVRIKRTGDRNRAREVTAIIPKPPPPTAELVKSLNRIAEAFVDGTLRESFPATYDLLASRDPRTTLGTQTLQPEAIDKHEISRVIRCLDSSYLFIQGPPGSGKTTNAAHAIADLLQAGLRVGVTSNGHKAIHNLLRKVEAQMMARNARFSGLYKSTDENSEYESLLEHPFILSSDDNGAFVERDYQLAGGTAWLFAREEMTQRFDYLFIDEAGQVPLANALAVSPSAKNIVLLGDPSQLAQVSLGTHAPHVDDSALQHLLGAHHTVAPSRGIFLNRSYRMHPEICSFISDAMYDGRLLPGDNTEQYRVESLGLSGSGLRYIPVEHDGNSGASIEEAERIVVEVEQLLAGHVVDRDGVYRRMKTDDIIIVTPYNAQRRTITSKLRQKGIDVRVGTVDKFQGQEASVVFYSMATSSAQDRTRDLDFLFEQNRFNVAISRAQAMSVLVCSPTLLDASCNTVEQIALVSLLCAYVEKSTLPERPGVSAAVSASAALLNG